MSKLPSPTTWAVAANAEFRSAGTGDLRGILHHDGAILRFTTWGGVERFVGAPMEFEWELLPDGTIHIIDRGEHRWFSGLGPLADVVTDPPEYAATADDLTGELEAWMRSWAPRPSAPLASPV